MVSQVSGSIFGYWTWGSPPESGAPDVGTLNSSQLGALIDSVQLQYESAALDSMFGDRPSRMSFPVLGAAIAGSIRQSGLNYLYGNLMDAPMSGQSLSDAVLYGFGNSPALDAAGMFNAGNVVDLLG